MPDRGIPVLFLSAIRNTCLLIIFYSAIIFSQENWINYTSENSGLPINAVHTVAIDNDGIKWIGTWGGGIARFDGDMWTVYNTTNSKLPNNTIYSIVIDSDNNKWIGTFGGGLAKFNNDTWTVYDTSNSELLDNTIYSLAFDKYENLLIGTWGKGFLVFDRKNKWKSFNYPGSPVYNHKVPALFSDSDDKLWIGTATSLLILSDTTWTNPGDSIPQFNKSVYSFVELSTGVIWVAFKQGGLAEYRNNKWHFYDTSNSPLPSNTTYHVAVDKNTNLWVSTFGTGLVKYNGKEWIIYDKSNSPLLSDFIFSTTHDTEGNIWVCTLDKGLYLIPPTE